MGTCLKRFFNPNKSVCSTGRRATFYYPNGGSYAGYWLCNKQHGWGVKTDALRSSTYFGCKKRPQGQLIYEGYWVDSKRQGIGSMLRKRGDDVKLIYAGSWYDDMKCGEGKQYYEDGCIYFGNWLRNHRHGLGIQWYNNGDIYLGEWETDFKHGLGVMFYANGNRYEGHFARGYKNGEGVFYHMRTGQIQKGMWDNDNVKVSVMQDEQLRQHSDTTTPYVMPINTLKYPNEIMRELFQRYRPMADKPHRRFNDKTSLEFIHKQRHFASFGERFESPSNLGFYQTMGFPCTCQPKEPLVVLCVK